MVSDHTTEEDLIRDIEEDSKAWAKSMHEEVTEIIEEIKPEREKGIWPTSSRTMLTSVADHQFLLDFEDDEDVPLFEEWIFNEGFAAFNEWLQKYKAAFNEWLQKYED